jgi:hypothetical protein
LRSKTVTEHGNQTKFDWCGVPRDRAFAKNDRPQSAHARLSSLFEKAYRTSSRLVQIILLLFGTVAFSVQQWSW